MAFLAANNMVLVHPGPMDWGAVVLASAIIFLILGRKLWRDIQRWLAPSKQTGGRSGVGG